MALLHNIMIRGYNSIFLQAPLVKQADVPDFFRYINAWLNAIRCYHASLKTLFLPEITRVSGIEEFAISVGEELGMLQSSLLLIVSHDETARYLALDGVSATSDVNVEFHVLIACRYNSSWIRVPSIFRRQR